jgi:hypothetical protein
MNVSCKYFPFLILFELVEFYYTDPETNATTYFTVSDEEK